MNVPTIENLREEIEENGFAIRENILSPSEITQLHMAIARIDEAGALQRRKSIYAVRNLLDISPEIRDLANWTTIRELVEPILGAEGFPVRGILFDKVADANWKVPWHQDVTIAVLERIETEGFGPWSIKSDVLHVQPPARILENMLSIRLHLDPCHEENGALRVIPGSHHQGRIPEKQIPAIREQSPEFVCESGLGGALLMRPLLLHASSPSQIPNHRRVIHIDFAAVTLPNGLRWFSEQ
jgi:ectoine hydroxylase-related dioxygenase (phytanoyl-CoA dioxygenase family)